MIVTFRIRRDTSANWTSTNPVLDLGEPGLETDTRRVKYGDGSTTWRNLKYAVAAPKPFLSVNRQASSGSFQTIGRAFTLIQLNTAVTDTATGYNTSTFLYTVPETGTYRVEGNYRLVEPATTGINCAIGVDAVTGSGTPFTDGFATRWLSVPPVTTGAARHVMAISRTLSATQGQVIRLYGYIDSGTAIGIQSGELTVTMI
jgi:hypothetical protein